MKLVKKVKADLERVAHKCGCEIRYANYIPLASYVSPIDGKVIIVNCSRSEWSQAFAAAYQLAMPKIGDNGHALHFGDCPQFGPTIGAMMMIVSSPMFFDNRRPSLLIVMPAALLVGFASVPVYPVFSVLWTRGFFRGFM